MKDGNYDFDDYNLEDSTSYIKLGSSLKICGDKCIKHATTSGTYPYMTNGTEDEITAVLISLAESEE